MQVSSYSHNLGRAFKASPGETAERYEGKGKNHDRKSRHSDRRLDESRGVQEGAIITQLNPYFTRNPIR